MTTWLFKNNMPVMALFIAISSLAAVSSANQAPKITIGIPYSSRKGVLQLSEDTPLNSYLAIMETKDDDSGRAGEVECVTDSPYVSIPLVYPKTYKVELIKELDREVENSVSVSILCMDKGDPPLTSTGTFTVEIMDINDNPPTFVKDSYNATVTEGVPIGTPVTTVKAIDPDAGQNGAVIYHLLEDTRTNVTNFTIDQKTGQIFTALDIDREITDQYVLTVVAKDSGLPPQSSSVHVKIWVEDINDNVPEILTKELHVKENQKQMFLVGSLLARDLDIGKNSLLVFSKVESSQSSSTAPFLIQPNGEILSVVSLDREQRSEYMLDVSVRDNGARRLSSKATVAIIVDDDNDHPPMITSKCFEVDRVEEYDADEDIAYDNYAAANTSNGVVVIDWYSTEDEKVVFRVDAVDEDSNENGKLRYSIESAVSWDSSNTTAINDPLFQIDSSTGEVTLRRFVRRDDNLVQILNISVADNGTPSLSAFCLLNITVDVDVSLLTTSRTTSVKGRYGNKDSHEGNSAVRHVSSTSLFNFRHLGASLSIILLSRFHVGFSHN